MVVKLFLKVYIIWIICYVYARAVKKNLFTVHQVTVCLNLYLFWQFFKGVPIIVWLWFEFCIFRMWKWNSLRKCVFVSRAKAVSYVHFAHSNFLSPRLCNVLMCLCKLLSCVNVFLHLWHSNFSAVCFSLICSFKVSFNGYALSHWLHLNDVFFGGTRLFGGGGDGLAKFSKSLYLPQSLGRIIQHNHRKHQLQLFLCCRSN